MFALFGPDKRTRFEQAVIQALLGQIAINFRSVEVFWHTECPELMFVLENNSPDNDANIESIRQRLDAQLKSNKQPYNIKVRIHEGFISRKGLPIIRYGKCLYMRKEVPFIADFWIARLVRKNGELLTEKIMPADKNIFHGPMPDLGDLLTVEFQDQKIVVRVIHYSGPAPESSPGVRKTVKNPRCYHLRVEEI